MLLSIGWGAFFKSDRPYDIAPIFLLIIFLIISSLTAVAFAWIGWRMFRRIDKTTIANFAFIFSAALAREFFIAFSRGIEFGHLSLLASNKIPYFSYESFHNQFRIAYNETLLGIVAFLLFFVFYHSLKDALTQLLIPREISVMPPGEPLPVD